MFRPLQDYVLVKPLKRIQSTIIEVISNEFNNRGEVISVGPGKYSKKNVLIPLQVKPGEIVHFGEFKNMFPEYYENGEKYLIVQEADLMVLDDADINDKGVH